MCYRRLHGSLYIGLYIGDSMDLLCFPKTENKSFQMLWKMSIKEIMARPLLKSSGFGLTVNFDLYLLSLVDDF